MHPSLLVRTLLRLVPSLFVLACVSVEVNASNRPGSPALDEPLSGSTRAQTLRDPGTLTAEGWKVTSEDSQLRWDLGRPYQKGTIEFEVKGELNQEDKKVLFALWETTSGGKQSEPRLQVRVQDEGMLLVILGNGVKALEKHTGPLAWPAKDQWVHIKVTFDTQGGISRMWRDGVLVRHGKLRGNVPGLRYAFLGQDNYHNYKSIVGLVFRNLRIYDLQ
ncbi:MAG: LamG-like jellyroll fold domain-containing protein [Opitutaceae bacterium]